MTKSQQLFLKIFGVSGIAFAIGLAGLLVWKAPEWQTSHIKNQISALRKIDEKDRVTLEKDRITLENATRSTLIQAFGGLFLVTTAYFSWRNLKATQRNLIASEEKQITERFSKAVELLGNANIHVRLGGIYALERISKDSERDYWQIIEILTAYVRENTQVTKVEESEKDITPVSTDIQAVLTVLTRRSKAYGHGEENPLDLSKSNLQKANLKGANLVGANLVEANLQRADLQEAKLVGANLQKAKLQEAKLQIAKLQGANLVEANLQGANLRGADLWGANLQEANLQEADLWEADLWGADLWRADLWRAKLGGTDTRESKNLTPEQVKIAKNWEDADYQEEFRALLGLPPKSKK